MAPQSSKPAPRKFSSPAASPPDAESQKHAPAKLIPSVLELGGKDAMIVLADADLDVASSAASLGRFHELWSGLPLRRTDLRRATGS